MIPTGTPPTARRTRTTFIETLDVRCAFFKWLAEQREFETLSGDVSRQLSRCGGSALDALRRTPSDGWAALVAVKRSWAIDADALLRCWVAWRGSR
jgi:hypothetical protein